MKNLIIFDLDGTLVDSFAGIQHALGLALAEFDREPLDLEWVRQHVGSGVRALMADAADGLDPDELLDRFRGHYDRSMIEMTPPFAGVDGMLARLNRDRSLAIASNKPLRWVSQLVSYLGWDPGIAAAAAPESVDGARKPEPAMILAIMDRLKTAPEATLLVGDMPIDAETGRNAGVEVVGVTTGVADRAALLEAGCVDVLESASELPEWLEERGL